MHRILLDTNVIVDYLMGREPVCSECKELIAKHALCEHVICVSSLSLKDAYYLVSMQLKRMERQANGSVTDASARSAREIAWSCVRMLIENVLVVPVGRAESLQAFVFKPVHGDFEDNLVLAAAYSANADFVVSNDAALLKHAPIACLSSADMIALIDSESQRDKM